LPSVQNNCTSFISSTANQNGSNKYHQAQLHLWPKTGNIYLPGWVGISALPLARGRRQISRKEFPAHLAKRGRAGQVSRPVEIKMDSKDGWAVYYGKCEARSFVLAHDKSGLWLWLRTVYRFSDVIYC